MPDKNLLQGARTLALPWRTRPGESSQVGVRTEPQHPSVAIVFGFLRHPNEASTPVQREDLLRNFARGRRVEAGVIPVSYTHLDVYKRQVIR